MTYKRKFSFVDANHHHVNLEAEIKEESGKKRFAISGDMGGCAGQIVDEIKPANAAQQLIVEWWHRWHLNDTKAGTELQMALTKGLNYDDTLKFLIQHDRETSQLIPNEEIRSGIVYMWDALEKCVRDLDYFELAAAFDERGGFSLLTDTTIPIRARFEKYFFGQTLLFDKHPVTGEDYRYGSEWLHRELPEEFERELDECIDEVLELEQNRKGVSLTELDDTQILAVIENITTFTDRDAFLCGALVKMFGLSESDLEDVEIDDHRATVQGIEYLAGSDDEMDEEWDKELDNYLEECIYPELNETAKSYFDDEKWKRDAKIDGRAHSLNHWDGDELYAEFDGVTYYAYHQ